MSIPAEQIDALVKTDRALARANGQIISCATWYEEIAKGISQ